jgi:SAM-dependent methyltransferase
LRCRNCAARYPQASGDYLDLRPAAAFAEQTRYLDEALHQDARHESVSPPLLQSGVRQRQLRRFLQFAPGDRVIDLGCGSGRSMLWNAASGAAFTGVDVSPFFAHEARAAADLALADLRQLPFADGSFTKAYALDVLEHLSPEALDAMLAEAARVLAPGGALFVYSHVRRNAPIARGLRAINALARGLERVGLIDMTQERLRKSDHLNPLRDVPHLDAVVDRAGFRIARIRYYTPIVGGFVENILMRMAERALARRAVAARSAAQSSARSSARSSAQSQRSDVADSARAAQDPAAGLRDARLSAKARLARGGPLLRLLQAVTIAMDVDLLLFGRIRSGPFFARLEKR